MVKRVAHRGGSVWVANFGVALNTLSVEVPVKWSKRMIGIKGLHVPQRDKRARAFLW